MEKKFNLSEKAQMRFNRSMGKTTITPIDHTNVYEEKDIKEFIRLLKLEMYLTWANNEILNKLAGSKLIDIREVKQNEHK